MKITLNWLKNHWKMNKKIDNYVNEITYISENLAALGFEVDYWSFYKPVVCGEILEKIAIKKTKLYQCLVRIDDQCKSLFNYESNLITILTNAKEFLQRDYVLFTPMGHLTQDNIFIESRKICNVLSHGMFIKSENLCKEDFGLYSVQDTILKIDLPTNRPEIKNVRSLAQELSYRIGEMKLLNISNNPSYNMNIDLTNSTGIDIAFLQIDKLNLLNPMIEILRSISLLSDNIYDNLYQYVLLDLGISLHIYDQKNWLTKNNKIVIQTSSNDLINSPMNTRIDHINKYKENEIIMHLNNQISYQLGIQEKLELSKNTESVVMAISNERQKINLNILKYITTLVSSYTYSEPFYKSNDKCASVTRSKVFLPHDQLYSSCGISISLYEMSSILKTIGCEVDIIRRENIHNSHAQFGLEIIPPHDRCDLNNAMDYIEEIIRIKGVEILNKKTVLKSHIWNENIYDPMVDYLAKLGFIEINSFPFLEKQEIFWKRENSIQLLNSLTNSKYMRDSLLPNLLKAADKLLNIGQKEIKLFEINEIYPSEEIHIGILIGGQKQRSPINPKRAIHIFDLKTILSQLGIKIENKYITHPKYQNILGDKDNFILQITKNESKSYLRKSMEMFYYEGIYKLHKPTVTCLSEHTTYKSYTINRLFFISWSMIEKILGSVINYRLIDQVKIENSYITNIVINYNQASQEDMVKYLLNQLETFLKNMEFLFILIYHITNLLIQ